MPVGNQQGGIVYNVDVVMCIDKTGSMSPILGEVKENAKNFYKKFIEKMEAEKKRVEAFRIKVIGFGDYETDERPMVISRFFSLTDEAENAEFESFLNSITAEGGGDEPENALEALAHAIKSDWTEDGNVRRHVILMFTDTSALELGKRTVSASGSEQLVMPANIAELGEWWDDMEDRAKRFVLFAPNGYPWDDLSVTWNNVIHTPSVAGTGCEEIDIDEAIRVLVQSMGTTVEQ